MTAPRKGATPEQQVVALGRLIEEQARTIAALKDEIERRFNAQAGDVAELRRVSAQATRTSTQALALITDVATRLGEDQAGEPEHTPPVNLLLAGDGDATTQVLEQLRDWLRAVYVRYEGAGDQPAPFLSDCWVWHPGAVTELHALYRMWVVAFESPRASDQAVADWHDRYRPGTVRRVNAALRDCRPEKHADPMKYRPPGVYGDELLGELAEWMVTGDYGRKAPPVPTPAMVVDSRTRRAAEEE
jgi:hypothetical protein